MIITTRHVILVVYGSASLAFIGFANNISLNTTTQSFGLKLFIAQLPVMYNAVLELPGAGGSTPPPDFLSTYAHFNENRFQISIPVQKFNSKHFDI